MENVPLSGWSCKWDLAAEVKFSGSGTVTYQSQNGESVRPTGTGGVLSPFRARLLLTLEVSAGGLSYRVVLGWARVTAAPKARDEIITVDGVDRVVASVVPLVWEGLERDIWRRGFYFPEHGRGSCWAELARITGFPVQKNTPDRDIPAQTVWEATQGGRLRAAQELGSLLGGRVVVTPDGALTVAPYKAGPVVATLTTGAEGTITELDDDISTEGVYTTVVGIYETENRQPIYSVAKITTGDLAVGGLYPESVRYHASDMVKNQASADKATQAVLEESIGSQSYQEAVQCVLNPLVELNDSVRVIGRDRDISGRIVSMSISDSALMTLIAEVPRVLA